MSGRDETERGEPSAESTPNGGPPEEPDRRRVLGYAGIAALAGSGVAGAWYVSQPDPAPDPGDGSFAATPSVRPFFGRRRSDRPHSTDPH